MARVRKNATQCMEYKKEDLLLSTGKSESYINGKYVVRMQQPALAAANGQTWRSFLV